MRHRSKYAPSAKRQGRKRRSSEDPFYPVKLYIPRVIYNRFQILARESNNTMNRALCALVYNYVGAKDAIKDFNMSDRLPVDIEIDTSWPTGLEESFGLYANEAGVLLSWLIKNDYGVTIDSIIMCRDDIGIPNRNALMFALYQLIREGKVSESTDEYSKHTKYRAVDEAGRTVKSFKTFEGEEMSVKSNSLYRRVKREGT